MTKARLKSARAAAPSKLDSKARAARRPARRTAARAPQIELRPSVETAKQHEVIAVALRFSGLDRVSLEVEPKNGFSLDAAEAIAPTTVRLTGKRDGIATLIATGYAGKRAVAEQLLHVRCVGPTLRILGFGYKPAR